MDNWFRVILYLYIAILFTTLVMVATVGFLRYRRDVIVRAVCKSTGELEARIKRLETVIFEE